MYHVDTSVFIFFVILFTLHDHYLSLSSFFIISIHHYQYLSLSSVIVTMSCHLISFFSFYFFSLLYSYISLLISDQFCPQNPPPVRGVGSLSSSECKWIVSCIASRNLTHSPSPHRSLSHPQKHPQFRPHWYLYSH